MSNFEIPSNLFSFKLNMIGDETGNKYIGKFIYRRPTIGMRREISQVEFILNQQICEKYGIEEPSPSVRSYNYTIAYLKICLEECPEWFSESDYGLNMQDENIINFISNQIKIFEDSRIEKIEKILSEPRKSLDKENSNE